MIAFKDINPQAPFHVLFIPKKHISSFNEIEVRDAFILENIFLAIKKTVFKFNIAESGYRIVGNCNKSAGQEVFHLHFHVMAGRKFLWPAG
ncbi:histidine triad (HIT) protein [Candidatus Omnitrophus magneticus]|uniref:Histidine triad (HIT) protein n=1 Tax=Candidatus Omnitrophus magneticus TaxID=1609969 RepID=A0A0F0CRB1_9BACT|nr:histidine triad (HIT) protein [Candidatus Omnitrophus magneticus]